MKQQTQTSLCGTITDSYSGLNQLISKVKITEFNSFNFVKNEKFIKVFEVLKKLNFHYTRDNTPKGATIGGVHFHSVVLGQHSSEKTSAVLKALCRFVQLVNRTLDPPRQKRYF